MNKDSKDYSVTQLQTWIADCMESGATPKEIYDSIIETVFRNTRYHKACYEQGRELYELLSQRTFLESVTGGADDIRYEFSNFNLEDFKLDSPALHDRIQEESPYNDGWTRQHYKEMRLEKERAKLEDQMSYDDMIKAGYEMTADGFWIPKEEDEEEVDT
tara:strand:- start:718 stop:1197 length:480 start_codon:yes stop_codon:yes gene_type:complete